MEFSNNKLILKGHSLDFELDQRLINPYSIFENKSPGDEATKAPSYLLTLGKE
jgi:hypothetical protein